MHSTDELYLCQTVGAGLQRAAAAETIEEKEKIRNKEIREASLKVAAYISLALKHLQHNTTIWLPYNFE